MILPMAFFGFGNSASSFLIRRREYGIQERPKWIFVFRCGPFYVDDSVEFGSDVRFVDSDRHDACQSSKLNETRVVPVVSLRSIDTVE
jgi:hypothetical protein